MLQRMHDGIRGWFAWLIIAILIISLCFFGINLYLGGGSADDKKDLAAKVNETVITRQEVSAVYEQIKQQNPGEINFSFEEQQRQSILQSLINKNLLLLAATKNDFRVPETEITNTLAHIPQFQEEGQFSPQRYLALLNQMGYSQAFFLAKLRQDILLNQIQAGLSLTDFVVPDEVRNMRNLIKQTRDFNYSILPFDQQSAPRMDLSKAVPQYYQEHLNQFQSPEKIRLNYLLLSDQEIKVAAPSDQQLKQFYQDNLSQYSKAPEWQLAHILISNENNNSAQAKIKIEKIQAAIKVGQDFSTLAKEFSDDLLTANKGGQLSFMTFATLPPEFQTVIKNLKQNQISNPIQTKQGAEIIKLMASKPAVVSSFEQVSKQIRETYLAQQRQKAFADKVQQLQDLVFQTSDSLEAAAQALQLSVQLSDWLLPNVPAKGLWSNPVLMQAAFSEPVKMGNNSQVLYPDSHTALVMHVKEYNAAKPIPLEVVESQIQTVLIEEARQKLTQAHAEGIAKALNEGASFEDITKQYGVKWSSVKNKGRHDPKQEVNSLILSTAFNLPRPKKSKKMSVGTHVLEKGVVVVAVTGVNDASDVMTASEQKIYTSQLTSYYNQLAFTELLNFYRKQAKVETFQA